MGSSGSLMVAFVVERRAGGILGEENDVLIRAAASSERAPGSRQRALRAPLGHMHPNHFIPSGVPLFDGIKAQLRGGVRRLGERRTRTIYTYQAPDEAETRSLPHAMAQGLPVVRDVPRIGAHGRRRHQIPP